MRNLEYADNDDIVEIMAQPWQLELLKMNPEYTSWGHMRIICGLKAEVEKSIQTYSLSIDKEAKFK